MDSRYAVEIGIEQTIRRSHHLLCCKLEKAAFLSAWGKAAMRYTHTICLWLQQEPTHEEGVKIDLTKDTGKIQF